jgi:surfactin synthase thioesterase subunit
MNTIDLYCLPFAGGNKYSYRGYMTVAPSFLTIVPLEYPGHGSRLNESLLTDLDTMIDDMYQLIKSKVDQRPYALYGHSMGGVAAFLLARKLIVGKHQAPLHLFITGTTGPAAESRQEKKRHLMNKQQFMEEIRALDGMPEEVLADEELFDYFEPILRADFKATETYAYRRSGPPLDLPITVITGTEEQMKDQDIRLWQEETVRTVDFRKLPGKHFFIFKYTDNIVSAIAEKLYPFVR